MPPAADAVLPAAFSSSQMVAEKVVREGIYGDFEYDLPEQTYDDARSTFKSAKETKSNKGTSLIPRCNVLPSNRLPLSSNFLSESVLDLSLVLFFQASTPRCLLF
jgi:hypothetical protein